MSSFDSLFIPIETSFGNAEPFTQPYGKKFLQLDTSPLTITDVPRMTPTNQSNIVTSSVFPRSASEALFDSSTKFRQLPCRTFISVGTCPYRERCVYLHDPRCICREAKTKTRRKNKEDVVVDSLFWPVMPYSLVAGKIDANRQPHVIQPYSVPVPQMDTYRSHDQAVYSMWMHFVDFCLATSESNSNANATVSADASPCYQAPDLPVNAYTDKERLDVFMRLSRELNKTHPGRSHNATPQQHMQMSRASSLDSFQDSRMMTPSSQHSHGSGKRTPANPAANSLLNLYSESNPNAHSGTNSALLPYFPATPPRALSMTQQTAAARRHQFSPCPQSQNHQYPSQQNFAAQDFYPGAHNKPPNLFVSPSPVSISALASPPSGYERKMSLGCKGIRSEGRTEGNFAFPSNGIFSNQPSLGGGVGDFSQPPFYPYDSCDAQGSSDFGNDEWHGSVSGSRSLLHGSDDHNDFSFSERSCSAADQWGEPVLRPESPGNHFPQWGNFAPSGERWSPPLQQPEWEVPVHFQQQQHRPNDDYFNVSQHSQQQSSAPLHTPAQQGAAVPKKPLSADAPVFRFEPKMHNASHSISSYASCSAIAKAH